MRNATLLDVGAGFGTIMRELSARGISAATVVESSPAYLAVAETEAKRLGYHTRVMFLDGDFVELAADYTNLKRRRVDDPSER